MLSLLASSSAETVVFVVAGVAIAIVLIVVMRLPSSKRAGSGATSAGSREDAAPVARAMLSPQHRPLLDRLRAQETRHEALDAVVARGSEIVPDLTIALADPAFASKADVPDAVRWALLEAIEKIGDPRAAPALAAMPRACCGAVDPTGTLAALGAPAALPVLLAALSPMSACSSGCGGNPVLSGALAGITIAGRKRRASPEFRDTLAPALADLVGVGAKSEGPSAADALVALDPEGATRTFTSDAFIARGGGAVHEGFQALANARVKVDGAVCVRMLDAMPRRAPEGAAETATLTSILRVLAISGHAEARPRIYGAWTSNEPSLRSAGRLAALTLDGLEHAEAFVGERLQKEGPRSLSLPQRVVVLVRGFLSSAGYDAFFSTPAAGAAADIEAALRAIGAGETADEIATARGRFRGGMPADVEERKRRVDEANTNGHSAFADLDHKLYDDRASIEERLADYIITHATEFRPRSPVDGTSGGATTTVTTATLTS